MLAKLRFLVITACLVFIAVASHAQQGLDNAAVLKLEKAGLGDDLIVSTINGQPGHYSLSTDDMIALKQAGVSDRVIGAMIQKNAGVPAGTAAVQSSANHGNPAQSGTSSDPNDPNAPHDPGIYMYTKGPNGMELDLLESSVYSQGKSGGFITSALTYGIAKIKMKAVIQGAHSNLHTNDSNVVFYFYFEESGKSFGGPETPNVYTLLKLDVKDNTRETQTGSMGATGSSTGTDNKATSGFTYSKIKPGIYKVIPEAGLKPGEYCFIPAGGQAGSAAANVLFAFGITAQ